MASSHEISDTHLWHIRLWTMERHASAEVGAIERLARTDGAGIERSAYFALLGANTSSMYCLRAERPEGPCVAVL